MTGERLGRHQYMVGDSAKACDWRYPHGHPIWQMSSKDGIRWHNDGQLTEEGRTMILEHFGLKTIEHELPLMDLMEMSPAVLAARRLELEKAHGFEHLEIVSTRLGGKIPAAIAA